jgi:hypothetical protein
VKDIDDESAQELLRRLDGMLDGPDDDEPFGPEDDLPSPEETRAAVEEAGIDMPAAVARIQARIAAFDAARMGETPRPPPQAPQAGAAAAAEEGAPESVGDPAPVAGSTLPPPSTMTSGEVAPHQLAALRRGRGARKRRQILGAGAATLALAAGVAFWWVAHPEEPGLVRKGRSSAVSVMGSGSSLVRPGAASAAPSVSAEVPDAGAERFGSGPGPGLRRVGRQR